MITERFVKFLSVKTNRLSFALHILRHRASNILYVICTNVLGHVLTAQKVVFIPVHKGFPLSLHTFSPVNEGKAAESCSCSSDYVEGVNHKPTLTQRTSYYFTNSNTTPCENTVMRIMSDLYVTLGVILCFCPLWLRKSLRVKQL